MHLAVITYGISTRKLSSFIRTWNDRTISSKILNPRGRRRKSWKYILRRSLSCNITLRSITLPVFTNIMNTGKNAFIAFSHVAIRKKKVWLSTSHLTIMKYQLKGWWWCIPPVPHNNPSFSAQSMHSKFDNGRKHTFWI